MKKELARYKTSLSSPLELYFHMEFLQDKLFCDTLTEDISTCGDGWECIPNVSSASSDIIPKEKGVYIFIWRPEFHLEHDTKNISFRHVVYVGSASSGNSDIHQRFNSNYKNILNNNPSIHWTEKRPTDRESRLKKVLNLGSLEYWYVTMDKTKHDQIQDIEKRLINVFNPPGNKTFKSPIRMIVEHDKVSPAFEPAF